MNQLEGALYQLDLMLVQLERRAAGVYLCYHLFMPSFSKYLLSTYYVLGRVLGSGATAVKKTDKIFAFKELTF